MVAAIHGKHGLTQVEYDGIGSIQIFVFRLHRLASQDQDQTANKRVNDFHVAVMNERRPVAKAPDLL